MGPGSWVIVCVHCIDIEQDPSYVDPVTNIVEGKGSARPSFVAANQTRMLAVLQLGAFYSDLTPEIADEIISMYVQPQP